MNEITNDFQDILANYKVKKLEPFGILVKKIGNPKALEFLKQANEKYDESVELNKQGVRNESKTAFIESENLVYLALASNYYEVSFKPGASHYLIVEQVDEKTESGLYLPPSVDSTKPYCEGVIIAIGDCYIKNHDGETLVKPINKIGDRVRYRKGMEISHDCLVNGKMKKCKSVDFTVVIGTIGDYISVIGSSEASKPL